MEINEVTEQEDNSVNGKKKIFVAGATGKTGKRIVEQLLVKGFAVKAGVRDLEKAKTSFSDNPALQFVSSFSSLCIVNCKFSISIFFFQNSDMNNVSYVVLFNCRSRPM